MCLEAGWRRGLFQSLSTVDLGATLLTHAAPIVVSDLDLELRKQGCVPALLARRGLEVKVDIALSTSIRHSIRQLGLVVRMTIRVRGPWTPSTRSSSMSLVAEGPLIQVWGRVGSSSATASVTVATTCVAFTTQTCTSGTRVSARRPWPVPVSRTAGCTPKKHPLNFQNTKITELGDSRVVRRQSRLQQRCVSAMRTGQPDDLFGERHHRAFAIPAAKTANHHHDHDLGATDWPIRHPALIATMDPL